MKLQLQHNTTLLQLLLKKVELPSVQKEDEESGTAKPTNISSMLHLEEVNGALKMMSEAI